MLLEISNLDVGYGDVEVITDVSLGVGAKEIVTILGSNGAGKSTLLSAVSGLLSPRRGDIQFREESILNLAPHRIVQRGIVLVPEGRHVFPSMTVLENLELGSFCPHAKEKRSESLQGVYSLFPRLKERLKQRAGTLSGGEQQMLAIGRGLMALPELLVLDEPSLGLAPIVVEEIFKAIKKVNEEDKSVLLVEQNALQSLRLATRGYVLENGHLILQGTVSDLLSNTYVKTAYLGV